MLFVGDGRFTALVLTLFYWSICFVKCQIFFQSKVFLGLNLAKGDLFAVVSFIYLKYSAIPLNFTC